jgi:hypothetical protein
MSNEYMMAFTHDQEGRIWDHINQFNLATFVYLSQTEPELPTSYVERYFMFSEVICHLAVFVDMLAITL